jgi:hypothetical protein
MYGSGEYYRTRTRAQLQELINGNMPGAQAHDAPRAELDRRNAGRWTKLTFWVAAAALIAGVVSAAAAILALHH